MNSCAYYQELISTLVDGEISREEHEALMLHLNTCSRCNAMYAVFHDLSDILSEEAPPLPEGLHENIMAGVRRSELMKKNRRMRRIGLRTALTAAACAVLVLFAAAGFDPGRRADSVSIRSEEAASQLLPAPSPATGASAPAENALPSAAPAPIQTPAPPPASNRDSGGSAAAYTPVQPEQNSNFDDPYQAAAPVWTPEPVNQPVWTPAPVDRPVWTPVPTVEPVWTPAPTEAPLQVPEAFLPMTVQESLETSDSAVFEAAPAADAPAVMMSAAPSLRAANDASALPVTEETTEAADDTAAETEDAPMVFSLFSSMTDFFDAAPAEQLTESKTAAPDAVFDALPIEEESPAPLLSGIPLELGTEAVKPVAEERVTVYGSEPRAKLLAMIGSSRDTLPQEAELTRLVHVSFQPDDAYGSEEKMDISIYGDFVYCSLYPVEGGSVTYQADCSLRELDSFLSACLATPAPSAAPTPDPYTEPTPDPAPDGTAEGAPVE